MTSQASEASAVHVHPLSDLTEHQLDEDCPCGPEQQPVKRDDGSGGWLAVRHSLDGRERRETRSRR